VLNEAFVFGIVLFGFLAFNGFAAQRQLEQGPS
jgi:hypothetical protein